jgi:hypothetical protein
VTPHDPLDSAINQAASRLTSAKPSDALRAGVMARIASERPSRFPWRFVFAGSAVAAMVIVGAVSFRAPMVSENPISNTPIINASKTPTPDPTGVKTPASPVTSVARTAAADDSGLVLATLTKSDEEWLQGKVRALERPELIVPVKPLFGGAPIKTIDIEPIRVAPLVVPAIDDNNQ